MMVDTELCKTENNNKFNTYHTCGNNKVNHKIYLVKAKVNV